MKPFESDPTVASGAQDPRPRGPIKALSSGMKAVLSSQTLIES